MAVAEMQKLNLVAMSYERDNILNALQKTGCVEIKEQTELENTAPFTLSCEDLREYLCKVEDALAVLSKEIENFNSDHKIKSDALKDGFAVSYSDFMSANALKEQSDRLVSEIDALTDERKNLSAELSKLNRTALTAQIYSSLASPFSLFADTKNVKLRLGTIPLPMLDTLALSVKEDGLCAFEIINKTAETALIVFAYHKSTDGESLLQAASFTPCPFKESSGERVYADLILRKEEIAARLKEIEGRFVEMGEYVKPLKIYCDYLGFELEKLTVSENMRATNRTLILEAYVPKEAEELVKTAIDGASAAVYYEFSRPRDDEMPPTLYKNNKVVRNFEIITDMYSPVNAREFDPNGVMSFFYSLFLGFIMGDIGYGILMVLGGGVIYYLKRNEDGGLKRMAAVFGMGGIFAILWGVLFGSLFGIEIIPPFMPNAKDDVYTVMGINIPAVLIIAMELGIVHLMAGYICKAIQHMRRGRFWDGIFDGFVWAVFSIGVGVAIVGFVEQANMPQLGYIGGGIAGGSLIVAMLTAGRKEKFFGKITKGFGAAYGIISYVSDVLSYARLYGLMLSGAVIAQIIAEYTVVGNASTVGFLVSGNPLLIILGVFIFVVGHIFNLAIGLLGAYIHDARLQYVEFFGRFYEGEGELFAPLGSTHKYIKLQSSAKN